MKLLVKFNLNLSSKTSYFDYRTGRYSQVGDPALIHGE